MTDNESENEESLVTENTEPEAVTEPQEKMVRQSIVDNVVTHTKKHAYEKGRRDALKELEEKRAMEQEHSVAPTPQSAPTRMGGMDQISPEKLQEMINHATRQSTQELLERQAEEMHRHESEKIANEFLSKIEKGKEKYDDFDKVVEDIDLPKWPEIVRLANNAPNTSDIMYILGKNPHKLSEVLMTAQRSPNLAQKMINDLGASISNNEKALNSPRVPEPLSQINPSPTSTDNGATSLKDLKRLFRG